jgi:hypothetical protein
MISVLALVVTILVAFVSPVVVWAVARQQIVVAAREAWMREFREQVAAIIACYARVQDIPAADLDAKDEDTAHVLELIRCVHVLRLLIHERGAQYEEFRRIVDIFHNRIGDVEPDKAAMKSFIAGAEGILRRERAAIEIDPGVWRVLWTSLGIGAVKWRPWSRFMAWCRRAPPRW